MHTVLIAEDDLKLQRFLWNRLQKKSNNKLEIVVASNGEDAIRILKQRDISLLITDIQMPKVDGLALLAYVHEKHAHIPCIVMTAYPTPGIRERLSDEAFRFFQKPFQLEEMVQTILLALESDTPDGSLKGISVASFLQMIEMEAKTCLLEIAPPQGGKGFFYFEHGQPCDATYADLKGEAAALELIAMDRPRIRFRNLPKKKIARRINSGLMSLIIEAMRRKDEFKSSGEGDGQSS